MDTGRRSFLGFFLALPALACAQGKQPTPAWRPPAPAPPDDPLPPLPSNSSSQEMAQQNWKGVKEDVEKLFELASELHKAVNSAGSAEVLSLPLVKKADEVEKLAKKIKKHARG